MRADPLAQIIKTRYPASTRKTRRNSYYRPKTYVANTGINPLVTMAAPLFTLMIALQQTKQYTDPQWFYRQLVHEVKAFDSAALLQYSPEFVTIARYILCAALDEMIQISHWGQTHDWNKRNLLSTFQQEQSANDRFFLILDHLTETPSQHIDMLEMIYLCLSLGFQGRYREQSHLGNEFERLIDTLYHVICKERGNIKKQLSVCWHFQKNRLRKKSKGPSLWRTSLVSILLLGSLYTAFNYAMFTTTTPLINSLQQIDTTLSIWND